MNRCGRAPVDPSPARSSSLVSPHTRSGVRYLLLLYGDPDREAALTDDERRAIVDEHVRFGKVLDDSCAMIAGEALEGPATAQTVRFPADGAAPYVTDGPFLEAKEALGGYYVLECEGVGAAIELA
jgi:hypothetical protein